MSAAPWIVNVKGNPKDFHPFEIALVRSDNAHTGSLE